METELKIGKKLKQLRAFHNFSMEHVAEHIGVQKSVYSDCEKDVVKIGPDRLLKAAGLYNVDLNVFFSSDPLQITFHNNAVANGYVEQQHNGDKGLYERMLSHMEERSKQLESLYAKTLDVFDRFSKNE